MSTEDKPSTVQKGLKGVMAADSSVSKVNGAEGKLMYRGYNIDDLATSSTFEEVAFLLLKGDLPTKSELSAFTQKLDDSCTLHPAVIEFLKSLPQETIPMAALRSAVSVAGIYDTQAEDGSEEANFEKSIRLTGMLGTITAAIHRIRNGEEPVAPDTSLSFAGSMMKMMTGKAPSEDETKAMDLLLILHAEHGFNASTFSGRVICATLTDIYSAVTGAIGALKGKLHGGANTEVLKALEKIGSVENVTAYVEGVKAAKGKFMGFGHAVYQVEDPRAKHLKALSKRLGEEQGDPVWYEMSVEMEKQVVALIKRDCNVDFYSASLQHYMGIPKELFTCIFASSRVSGWCAHILEQLADNKIIRPSAHYVGAEERPYVSISER